MRTRSVAMAVLAIGLLLSGCSASPQTPSNPTAPASSVTATPLGKAQEYFSSEQRSAHYNEINPTVKMVVAKLVDGEFGPIIKWDRDRNEVSATYTGMGGVQTVDRTIVVWCNWINGKLDTNQGAESIDINGTSIRWSGTYIPGAVTSTLRGDGLTYETDFAYVGMGPVQVGLRVVPTTPEEIATYDTYVIEDFMAKVKALGVTG